MIKNTKITAENLKKLYTLETRHHSSANKYVNKITKITKILKNKHIHNILHVQKNHNFKQLVKLRKVERLFGHYFRNTKYLKQILILDVFTKLNAELIDHTTTIH